MIEIAFLSALPINASDTRMLTAEELDVGTVVDRMMKHAQKSRGVGLLPLQLAFLYQGGETEPPTRQSRALTPHAIGQPSPKNRLLRWSR